jgi:alkanesulfonate monooxygenase SsuD/methylene tetrahydromethanopterin reductase-like flavin-dependent oxidoreductase (luciferase family)
MASEIRFGVQYNGVSMASIMGPIAFAQQAEQWGFDAYFVPDLETLSSLDPMTLLASVAQHTNHIMLGTGVLVVPFRSPYQLAKVAASVDILTNERLILGLGAGLLPKDFAVEQVDRRKRGTITDEALRVIRSLLAGDTVNHSGDYYEMTDTHLAPAPTRQIPIWLGGSWNDGFADAVINRVATLGDGFHPTDVPVEGYAAAINQIEGIAAGQGRDVDFDGACNMWLNIGANKNDALAAVQSAFNSRFGDDAWEAHPEDCYALGTPADCIETIERYADVGVRTFVMNVLTNPEGLLPTLETFSKEVFPTSADSRKQLHQREAADPPIGFDARATSVCDQACLLE